MPRTYRDPIHREITLNERDSVEALLIKLIDTKELQRLRWIRQLGTSWFTFHGAEASRFQHSLGAMHVARLMLNQCLQDLDLEPDTEISYRAAVMSAALLHDIGHGPFSHSCEKIIKTSHEVWTRKLILAADSQVNQCLRAFDEKLPELVVQILDKTYPRKFLCNIVSSQIDCDRFDYLLRDSYYTGTAYGQFDLQRVISSISVNTEHDCLVVRGEKGMLAVEDYLYARYSMYLQVYQHKKCLATDSLLQKLFKRVKILVRNKRITYLENELYSWVMSPDTLSTKDFLKIDDTYVLHHIKHWVDERDYILKDLARRFIERDIFKAYKVSDAAALDTEIASLSEGLRKRGLEPEYYIDVMKIASSPYSFYNPDRSNYSKAIFVENNDGTLSEISELSHVVSALVKNNYENTWLISLNKKQLEAMPIAGMRSPEPALNLAQF